MMTKDNTKLIFKSDVGNDNCVCDCCHDLGKVTKITFPTTKYRRPKYDKLKTNYKQLLMCDCCLEQMKKALVIN